MAVNKKAQTAAAAVKAAFEDLLQQVTKHKDILRASHKWQRVAPRQHPAPGTPVQRGAVRADSGRGVSGDDISDDIRSYVNANLARLDRFVEREIYFREAQDGMLARDSVSKDEVIDEAIAAATQRWSGQAREACARALALPPGPARA